MLATLFLLNVVQIMKRNHTLISIFPTVIYYRSGDVALLFQIKHSACQVFLKTAHRVKINFDIQQST